MAFYKKNNNKLNENKSASGISQEVRDNSAQSITNARRLNTWLDEAFSDFSNNGGLEDLPGKGKPINISDGDVLNSILKNANFLPPWIETQKEVRNLMKIVIDSMDLNIDDIENAGIERINNKIRLYNRQVPSPLLQKGLVSIANIKEKYEYWE